MCHGRLYFANKTCGDGNGDPRLHRPQLLLDSPVGGVLFTLTNLPTGIRNHMILDTYFGQNYNHWSYAHLDAVLP